MSQASSVNRKDIRRAEKAARQTDVARGEVLRRLMAAGEGRQWIWDRLDRAGIFSGGYDDNPTRMAYLAGHRDAGLALLADVMEFCPDQFVQAMREANGRRTADRSATEHARGEDAAGGVEGSDPTGFGLSDRATEASGGSGGGRIVQDPNAPGGFRIEGIIGQRQADGEVG